MKLKEKLELLKSKGYTYDKNNGVVLNKNKKKCGYICHDYLMFGSSVNNISFNVYVHQYAWFFMFNEVPNIIDHINHNKTDNRIINLRNITAQQNLFNQLGKGFYIEKLKNGQTKYNAQIRLNGKLINIGRYNTEEEAHNAYLEAKKLYHKI